MIRTASRKFLTAESFPHCVLSVQVLAYIHQTFLQHMHPPLLFVKDFATGFCYCVHLCFWSVLGTTGRSSLVSIWFWIVFCVLFHVFFLFCMLNLVIQDFCLQPKGAMDLVCLLYFYPKSNLLLNPSVYLMLLSLLSVLEVSWTSLIG